MNEYKRIIFSTLAAAVFLLISRDAALSQAARQADVRMSYLPGSLVAAARGSDDIPVEVELIFSETTGVGARFDQMKRTFLITNGMTLEEPVTFINLQVGPGMEDHQKVTLVIPGSTGAICLGASTSCDLSIRLAYTGLDANGNSAAATIDVPVHLTKSSLAETFAVGDVVITSPADGSQTGAGRISASARISVTGVGTVAGQWLLNGGIAGSFSKDVIGEGEVIVDFKLPEGLEGGNTLKLRVTQPVVKESKEVRFDAPVAGKLVLDAKSFRAGAFTIEKVDAKAGSDMRTVSGRGIAVHAGLGLEIPVTFEGLTIVEKNGAAVLAAGQIIADADRMLERGPLKVEIKKLLIAASGSWADGSAVLEPSGMTAGIGPLFFYALPFDEKGIGGVTSLEHPQKGRQGGYEAEVGGFDLRFDSEGAVLKVNGSIMKPGVQAAAIPLNISVSLGKPAK